MYYKFSTLKLWKIMKKIMYNFVIFIVDQSLVILLLYLPYVIDFYKMNDLFLRTADYKESYITGSYLSVFNMELSVY